MLNKTPHATYHRSVLRNTKFCTQALTGVNVICKIVKTNTVVYKFKRRIAKQVFASFVRAGGIGIRKTFAKRNKRDVSQTVNGIVR